jgi:signal recognition particle subunit SRP54
MFDTLSDRLDKVFTSLRGKGRLSDADIDATAREIRIALLEADVALPVVKAFIAAVKERARGAEVSQALNPAQQVVKIVNEELVGILGGETRVLRFAKTPPTVIMLAGLQGAGKTTLAGKLAQHLRAAGHVPLLVACDLQRPNAVQQLQVVGGQAGVDVFAPYPGSGVGDPVDAARTGVEHARRMHHDVVVVDTAGRLGIDADMMQQAADIRDAVQPDEVLFVVDAMIGQDAVVTGAGVPGRRRLHRRGPHQARRRRPGGAALSVRHLTGQPIMFASTGEKLGDFDVFHPERMASRILGMGDVLTLIEQAEKSFDAGTAERMAGKMMEGKEFDLEDFLEQMMQVKKMGSLSSLLGMLPGMGQMKDALAQVDDKDLDRIAAIIRSMTPQERRTPKILNGSRRMRIAKGSGVTVTEVNNLVDRFYDAQKMMKQMGGMAGMTGMPGLPGGRKAKRQQSSGKKGKKGPGRAGRWTQSRAPARGRSGCSAHGPAAGLPAAAAGLPAGSRRLAAARPVRPPPPSVVPHVARVRPAVGDSAAALQDVRWTAPGVRGTGGRSRRVRRRGPLADWSSIQHRDTALYPSLVCHHDASGAPPPLPVRSPLLPSEQSNTVAVKIKLMRLGKMRAPYYRIVVADARTKREGRVIETIGKYHPKENPSFIEVDGDRAAYWLGVGAQPTEPVAAILKVTGDWQRFKGLPAPRRCSSPSPRPTRRSPSRRPPARASRAVAAPPPRRRRRPSPPPRPRRPRPRPRSTTAPPRPGTPRRRPTSRRPPPPAPRPPPTRVPPPRPTARSRRPRPVRRPARPRPAPAARRRPAAPLTPRPRRSPPTPRAPTAPPPPGPSPCSRTPSSTSSRASSTTPTTSTWSSSPAVAAARSRSASTRTTSAR